MSDNLASRLERSQVQHAAIEDEVTDAIIGAGLSLDQWSDWHYDPYDGELLITGCAGLSDDQITKLRAHGFRPRAIR